MDFDWKKTLGAVAPTLATALGGPMAGMAANLAVKALGINEKGAPEPLLQQAIKSGDPETLAKLKEAERAFLIELERLGIEKEKLAAHDRADARKREINLGGWSNPILAGVVICGFFATVGYVLAGDVNLGGESGALIGTLIGYVSAKADQICSYYFGSSSGQDRNLELTWKSHGKSA